jgi:hydroxymethylbilane synthase
VKEIEEALLSRRVDIAVHRAKDMPSDDLASLEVAAALPREDARDALILPGGAGTIPFAVAVERLPADPPLGPERKRST